MVPADQAANVGSKHGVLHGVSDRLADPCVRLKRALSRRAGRGGLVEMEAPESDSQ